MDRIRPSNPIEKCEYEVALSRLMTTCNHMAEVMQKVVRNDATLVIHKWEAQAERRVYLTIAAYIRMLLKQGITIPDPEVEDPLVGVMTSMLQLKFGQLALQASLQEPKFESIVRDELTEVKGISRDDIRSAYLTPYIEPSDPLPDVIPLPDAPDLDTEHMDDVVKANLLDGEREAKDTITINETVRRNLRHV